MRRTRACNSSFIGRRAELVFWHTHNETQHCGGKEKFLYITGTPLTSFARSPLCATMLINGMHTRAKRQDYSEPSTPRRSHHSINNLFRVMNTCAFRSWQSRRWPTIPPLFNLRAHLRNSLRGLSTESAWTKDSPSLCDERWRTSSYERVSDNKIIIRCPRHNTAWGVWG